jgi:hypothetical protein
MMGVGAKNHLDHTDEYRHTPRRDDPELPADTGVE